MQIIILVVIFIIMYFLMIRPQQKKQREHREMLTRIEAGQNVTTIEGIKAKVRSVDETQVVLVLNKKGDQMTVEKPAIKQIDPS
ncbi:preprotein translocase subunit YajC [Staphylococcus sp. SQ8-PEA]|uniref:Preprotein translocase subunit YajC n=1 Tax=Staphylococcus marylandisciuri TaxID=2981529 RepID=A0ABT2QPY8_9STAP|nr:preprotein translocase subunit YajC [Staphylococcus marylandisciuri]MCU5746049.1 preprotein translocase subunit YajC [Staphylococcus marylandisciuri]